MRPILKENLFPSVHKLRLRIGTMLLVIAMISGTACGAAETGVQQIPTFPEIQQTPETIEKVGKLEEEGEKLFKAKQFDRALAKWQEAYGMSIEMKLAEGEGRNLTNMCRIFLERGQFVKAKYMGENAIEVLSQISDRRDLGRARVQLARAYFGLDNPVWAGQQLDEALKIFTQETGNNAPDAAEILSISAALMLKMGNMKDALKFYEQSATYYLQANNQLAAIQAQITIAAIMQNLGLYVAASEVANKAVSQAKACDSKTALIAAMTELANSQFNLCEFANSRKTYEQILALADKIDNKELGAVGRSNIDVGFGFALAATGDPDQARIVLERAMPGLRKAGTLASQAEVLNALAIIEETQGQHTKAVQYLSQGLDLQQVLSPKRDKLHVVLLENMAAIEARSGDGRNARIHLEQALGLLKKLKDPLQEGRTLSSLAEVTLKLADSVQAESYLKRAITISEKINDDAALWRDYTILARIQFSQELVPQGKESLASALSYFRSPQAGVFPSPDQLMFPSTREELGQRLVAMVAKHGMAEQALLTAEQLKEEAFSSDWHRRGGLVKPEDRDVYTDLVTQRAHLHACESSSTPNKLLGEWHSWQGRFRTLVSQNKSLARMIAPVPSSLADVMKSVQARHATIVEYLVGVDSSVVFTVDASGRISSTVLPVGNKRLQTQVSALLAQPATADAGHEQSDQRERVILQALYNELLPASVRNFIPKNPDQMVVIIPDGVLFNLPFAALVDGQGKYLVENHTLTMASSMGVFLDSPPRYTDDLSVVLTSQGQASQAGDESNMISKVLQPELVTRMMGADIGAITEQARGKAVVHFTTNMPLSANNPMRSYMPVASGKDDGNRKVTCERLFEMSIPSDLMVMSASSVNSKDVQGNAVKVFSRGLSYAGVRNVMMSLWVEPETARTHELIEFYKGKQEGLNQAQSLRKAQLLALSRDPSPRSWAAFQLLGPGF